MTLQKKTLLIIALTLGVPILVLYFTSQAIVLGRFSSIENDEAVQNIQRVQSALDDDLTALESTTRDWSMWDDTFQFIADRNQDYIESNLTGSLAMDNNRLDVMLFYDAQGNEVFAKASDYQGGSQTPQPTSLLSRIGPDSPLLQHTSAASSIKGLISLPEGAMLLASEPIMHSSGEGEIGGTLIFGRFLNTDAIEHLAKTTLIGLSLTPLSSLSASEDPEGPVPQLSVEAPMQLIARSDDKLDGYYLLTDVLGNPALVLEAEMPRVVYNKGVQNLYSYLLILLTVGILLGVVMTLLMKRLVLSRLELLRHEMGKISLSSDISHRVNMPGKDEFSDLSISINDMLAALHRSREEQWESEQRYKAVVEQTREAIFLVDAVTGHFVEANASFQAMLDYTFDELTKLRLADITVSGGDKTGILIPDTTGVLRLAVEKRYRRRDGSVVNVEVSDSSILYGGRDVLCVVARDITDRKRAEAALRELARRDGLTGLYNHREMQRILQEQTEHHLRANQPLAFILLDIDHFKTVNDTYGHQVGDAVLQWMALLIPQLVRPTDSVARYGGEELAIILPDTSIETAYALAEHLRGVIAGQLFEFPTEGTEEPVDLVFANSVAKETEPELLIPITISLGVSGLGGEIGSEESLVYAADRALYAAKHQGRNCTVTSTMQAKKLRLVGGN